MIIDFHTHTFPDAIAGKAIHKLMHASHSAAFTDGTSSGLCKSMKNAGIDKSVVLPVATNPDKVGHINDVSAEANGQNGLIFFGAMHPDCPEWKSELSRCAALGFKGIKIHPVYQHVDFDDVRFLRILDRAYEVGLCVVTHSGDDIGFPGEHRISPEHIIRAVRQTDKGTLILAHMGGWRCWDRLEPLIELNVKVDTSFSLGNITPIDDHYTSEDLRMLDDDTFVSVVRMFGADRVLFGTDSPWADQKKTLDAFLSLPLTAEEKEKILHLNAERILV